MRMKIKAFCIILLVVLSSTWVYAKPKFEDVRVFEAPSQDGLFIITGDKTAIVSTGFGMKKVKYTAPAKSKSILFFSGLADSESESVIGASIDGESWDEKTQGYSAYTFPLKYSGNRRFVVKPLDIYPKHLIQNVKLLHNSRRFSIFEKTASDVTFNVDTGEVVERNKNTSSGKSFRDGSIQFSIPSSLSQAFFLDHNSAHMFGTEGSTSVAFYRDKKCLIFTETHTGGKHVLKISATYDPSEMGFRYLSVRNEVLYRPPEDENGLPSPFSPHIGRYTRTLSHGIAKVESRFKSP